MKFLYKILITLILLVVITIFNFSRLSFKGRYDLFIVSNETMRPVFSRGDIVISKSEEFYGIGDVIVFINPTNFKKETISRINNMRTESPELFLTKQDAVESPDPWEVTQDLIIGRSWLTIPGVGYPVLFLSDKRWVVVLVSVVLVFIFFLEINSMGREIGGIWERRYDSIAYRRLIRWINRIDSHIGNFINSQ